MGFQEEELDAVNQRNTKEYIPAIVVISIVLATGLCLNTFASMFYGRQARKSAFQIFVMSLSVNFLITNLVLLYDIVELFYFVKFESVMICKLFYVLKHWFVGNSLFFMVAIGFDRYRTVCFPFSKSLTLRTAWCIILGLTIFSFCISVSLFVTTDIVQMNITVHQNATINGYTCTFSLSEDLETVRVISHFLDVAIHAIIIFLFVFFYSFITRKLIITRKKVNVSDKGKVKMEVFKIGTSEHSEMTSEISTRCEDISEGQSQVNSDKILENTMNHDHPDQAKNAITTHLPFQNGRNGNSVSSSRTTIQTYNNDVSNNGHDKAVGDEGRLKVTDTVSLKRKSVKSKTRWERQITVMATVKTVSSIACFLPFYVSMMIVSPKLNGDGLVLGVWSILARRSFILNSAINPIIMIIFNDSFKQYLKAMFHKVISKFRKHYRPFK